jgi:hypothetical protein
MLTAMFVAMSLYTDVPGTFPNTHICGLKMEQTYVALVQHSRIDSNKSKWTDISKTNKTIYSRSI